MTARRNPQKLVAVDPAITLLTLKIPLPPRELQPNRKNGRHWGNLNGPRNIAHLQAQSAFREECADGKALGWQAVGMAATFVFRNGAVRDPDNLVGWLKATVDALASELGINDKHCHWDLEPNHKRDPKVEEHVFMVLRKKELESE